MTNAPVANAGFAKSPNTHAQTVQYMGLHTHQANALERLSNGKILYGGVGSGKSRTSVAYYLEAEAPRDVYVITTAKKRDSLDWEGEFARIGVGKTPDATRQGVLTVDSWNNIAKYADVRDAFFVFDEQRLVGSGAWTKAFLKIARANRWILLSGTPGDTWLDYIPVFVANGFYKNRTEFKTRHVVYNNYAKFPKVDHYVDTGILLKHRNNILVHMPYKRHTTRHLKKIHVDHDVNMMKKVMEQRWHVYEQRPLRNVAELFGVMRRVANTDSSRIAAVQSLMEKHQKVIVFYNFDYELEMLRTICGSITATWQKKSLKLTDSTQSVSTAGEFPDSDTACKNDQLLEESWETESYNVRTSGLTGVASQECRSGSPIAMTNASTVEGNGSQTWGWAEWNGHLHQAIPKTDSWIYLVQYVAGAEAWDCTETNAIVFFSLTYSYKNFEQAQGRIDRMNTKFEDLYYYILSSDALIDRAIWKSLEAKKNFNERDFAKNT